MNKTVIIVIVFISFIFYGFSSNNDPETNPVKMFFNMLLSFYRNYITEQDGPRCQFSPSCSRYSYLSFKIADPVQSLLMTSDRLLRCNPFAYMHYPQASDKLHLYDPPYRHKLWGKKEYSNDILYYRMSGANK